jgi:hypothetical protein
LPDLQEWLTERQKMIALVKLHLQRAQQKNETAGKIRREWRELL